MSRWSLRAVRSSALRVESVSISCDSSWRRQAADLGRARLGAELPDQQQAHQQADHEQADLRHVAGHGASSDGTAQRKRVEPMKAGNVSSVETCEANSSPKKSMR